MEQPGSISGILRRLKSVAPLTEADAEQLHQLLAGVSLAADRMAALAPIFPADIDTGRLSQTVDGDDGS